MYEMCVRVCCLDSASVFDNANRHAQFYHVLLLCISHIHCPPPCVCEPNDEQQRCAQAGCHSEERDTTTVAGIAGETEGCGRGHLESHHPSFVVCAFNEGEREIHTYGHKFPCILITDAFKFCA